MSNNKQSSIDWLETQLKKGVGFNPRDPLSYLKAVHNLFQQAKAMHEVQVRRAFYDGQRYEGTKSSMEYYNETFGGNK